VLGAMSCETSVNGENETYENINIPFTSTIGGVTFGNNIFVAVGTDTEAMNMYTTSINGLNWSNPTSLPGVQYNSNISFASNRFFISINTGTNTSPIYSIHTSTNAASWTTTPNPLRTLDDVAFGNGRFIGVGSGLIDTNKGVITSTDGTSWTIVDNYSVPPLLQVIAFGNNVFVAATAHTLYYSSDGLNWTQAANHPFATGINRNIKKIVFGNNIFVAVSSIGIMAYSADGINWIEITNHPFGNLISSVAFGSDMFVAVGGTVMAYSTDGINWIEITNHSINWGIMYIAASTDTFVIANQMRESWAFSY
jgi:hypothetical protein